MPPRPTHARPPVSAASLVRAQKALESFHPAPDGSQVVVGIRTVQGNAYRAHLWVVAADGGRPRRLTNGAVRDTGPQVSPDGVSVAFVRVASRQPGAKGRTGDDTAQAWMVPLAGGRARRLTRLKHGVDSVHWSPDCQSLAMVGAAGDPRFVVGPQRDGVEPVARHITRTDWRDDDSGLVDRRSHLWVLDVSANRHRNPNPVQLTHGDFDVGSPAWSPDSQWIAFDASMEPDWNIRYRYRIFRVRPTGGPIRELVSLRGDARGPAYSPDGLHLAFSGTDVPDPSVGDPDQLWVSTAAGGKVRCLSRRLDRAIGAWAWADLAMADDTTTPSWDGNDHVVAVVGIEGRVLPYRFSLDGAAPAPMVDPTERVVGSMALAADGRVMLSAGLDGRGSDLFAVEAGELRRLTSLGSAWQHRFPHFVLEELAVRGPAGPIQVWLASPPDAGTKPLPTIFHFHGGPDGCWAPGGTMDSLLLTAHGYRIAMPNIRGSTTHGRAWIEALSGQWGVADVEDVHAVADALVARRLADPDRMGLMGLSYGGYLVQWLVGVTDRFAAAVAENGVANVVSDWGESYFGVHYGRQYGQGDPLTEAGAAELWRQSPLRNAAQITTPLLLLQAEEDRTCPRGANEQLFVALKVLERPTEYVLYPEEHHGMKNEGRPDRRIDRMDRHLAWFDRYLRRP